MFLVSGSLLLPLPPPQTSAQTLSDRPTTSTTAAGRRFRLHLHLHLQPPPFHCGSSHRPLETCRRWPGLRAVSRHHFSWPSVDRRGRRTLALEGSRRRPNLPVPSKPTAGGRCRPSQPFLLAGGRRALALKGSGRRPHGPLVGPSKPAVGGLDSGVSRHHFSWPSADWRGRRTLALETCRRWQVAVALWRWKVLDVALTCRLIGPLKSAAGGLTKTFSWPSADHRALTLEGSGRRPHLSPSEPAAGGLELVGRPVALRCLKDR